MTHQSPPRFLDVSETTNRTSLRKTKLYELINSGELRPIKLGRKTVFSEQEDLASKIYLLGILCEDLTRVRGLEVGGLVDSSSRSFKAGQLLLCLG